MARRKSRPRAKAKVKVRTSKPNRKAHNTIIEKGIVVRTEIKRS